MRLNWVHVEDSKLDLVFLFLKVNPVYTVPIPGGPVGHVLVEIGEGDGVLGGLLIVGNAGVLEPVAPQDLVRQVGRPYLQHIQVCMNE
jgi:hypothetical protein